MPVRSIITLLASWFAACLLPAYAQTSAPLQFVPLETPCRAVDTRVGRSLVGQARVSIQRVVSAAFLGRVQGQ
jgi:hypothetical protein